MSEPTSVVPTFNRTDSHTCEEYDAELGQIATEQECLDAKLEWQVDLASYCGCQGAELDTNVPNGCSLCEDDETFSDPGFDITSGYPLTNMPLTCTYVNDVTPYLKYISSCEEFQDNYGTYLCCKSTPDATSAPTAAPTSSTTPGIRLSLDLLSLIVCSVVILFCNVECVE